MIKIIFIALSFLFIGNVNAGLLQNEDFKTEAELVTAGGTKAQLLNDTKIYVTANSINKTLDDAIVDGDIGGGGGSSTTVTKTATATLATTGEDNVVLDATIADFTINLPTAVGNNGLTYSFNKVQDTNKVTIDGSGAETVDGYANIVLSTINDSVIITSDGTNWKTLSDNISESLKYRSNASQTLSSGAFVDLIMEDVEYDPQSSYNSATGVFTAKYRGTYLVQAHIKTNNVTMSTTQQIAFATYISGNLYFIGQATYGSGANISYPAKFTDTYTVQAGETILIKVYSDVTTTLSGDARENGITITRIN